MRETNADTDLAQILELSEDFKADVIKRVRQVITNVIETNFSKSLGKEGISLSKEF